MHCSQADAKLIYDNALLYNEKDSIYYLAAVKFRQVVEQAFAMVSIHCVLSYSRDVAFLLQQSLAYLYKTKHFMKEVPMSQLGLPADAFVPRAPDDRYWLRSCTA